MTIKLNEATVTINKQIHKLEDRKALADALVQNSRAHVKGVRIQEQIDDKTLKYQAFAKIDQTIHNITKSADGLRRSNDGGKQNIYSQLSFVPADSSVFNSYAEVRILDPKKAVGNNIEIKIDNIAQSEAWTTRAFYSPSISVVSTSPSEINKTFKAGTFDIRVPDNMKVLTLLALGEEGALGLNTPVVASDGSQGTSKIKAGDFYIDNATINLQPGDTIQHILDKINGICPQLEATFANKSIAIRSRELGADNNFKLYDEEKLFDNTPVFSFESMYTERMSGLNADVINEIDLAQRYEQVSLSDGETLSNVAGKISAKANKTLMTAVITRQVPGECTLELRATKPGIGNEFRIKDGTTADGKPNFLYGDQGSNNVLGNIFRRGENFDPQKTQAADTVMNINGNQIIAKSDKVVDTSLGLEIKAKNVTPMPSLYGEITLNSDAIFNQFQQMCNVTNELNKLLTNYTTRITNDDKPEDKTLGILRGDSLLEKIKQGLELSTQRIVDLGFATYTKERVSFKGAFPIDVEYDELLAIGDNQKQEIINLAKFNPTALINNMDYSFESTDRDFVIAEDKNCYASMNGFKQSLPKLTIDMDRSKLSVRAGKSALFTSPSDPVVLAAGQSAYNKFTAGTFFINDQKVTLSANDTLRDVARRINRVAPGSIELVDAGSGNFYLDFKTMRKANGGGYQISDPSAVLGKVFEKIEVTKPFDFSSTSDVELGNNLVINGLSIATTAGQTLDEVATAINNASNQTGVALELNPADNKYFFVDDSGKNYLVFKALDVANNAAVNLNLSDVFKNGTETIARPSLSQSDFVYNTSNIASVTYRTDENNPATQSVKAAGIALSDPANLLSANSRVVVFNTDNSPMKFANLEIGYEYYASNHAVTPVARYDNKGVEITINAGMASLLSNNLLTYTEDAGKNNDSSMVQSIAAKLSENKAERDHLYGEKRRNDIEEDKERAKANIAIGKTTGVFQQNMALKGLSKIIDGSGQ